MKVQHWYLILWNPRQWTKNVFYFLYKIDLNSHKVLETKDDFNNRMDWYKCGVLKIGQILNTTSIQEKKKPLFFSLSNSRLKDEKWRPNQPKVLIYNRFPVSFFRFMQLFLFFRRCFIARNLINLWHLQRFFLQFVERKKFNSVWIGLVSVDYQIYFSVLGREGAFK